MRMTARVSVSLLALAAMLAFVGVAANASAGIDALPERIASALEISEDSAKMLLGTAILVSAGLCMAIADAPVIAIAAVMIAVLGFLVLIDWMYEWLLIVIVVMIVAMFARDPMAKWFAGSGG